MFPTREDLKLFLITIEISFGIVVLLIASRLIELMAITNDWFGYALPALVLIIVGTASVSFGVDTLWLREEVDRWDPWE